MLKVLPHLPAIAAAEVQHAHTGCAFSGQGDVLSVSVGVGHAIEKVEVG